MALTKRRSEKPVAELSERQLRAKLREARLVIERLPDNPPGREAAKLLPVLETAARERERLSAELQRREAEHKQAEQQAWQTRLLRVQRQSGRSPQAKAFEAVARFGHPELQGEKLVAERLTDELAAELLALATRRGEQSEPLSDEELRRYELLVGTASGEEGLFEKKRSEQAEAEKRAALEAAERRHPQAEDLVAAVMSDRFLFDGLQHRLRPGIQVTDELGVERQGHTAAHVFDLDNVSALFVLVSLFVRNGGRPIEVSEHGVLGDGLPQLPRGALTQLRRNQYLTVEQEGAGMLVGPGQRIRELGARWLIQLPDE